MKIHFLNKNQIPYHTSHDYSIAILQKDIEELVMLHFLYWM